MKSLITFTVIMCFLIFRSNPAFSEDINVNQTFSSDTTFYPFSSLDEIYSLNIMDSDLPLISAYARGLLVEGRFIDFTETVSFPSGLKSYPDYYYLDPKATNFPEEEHLLLFPNPSGDYVIAYFNSVDFGQKGVILIDDIQGKRIAEMPLDSQQNQLVINLSAYPNGIYFINLIINGKLIESEKLSKSGN